MKYFIKNFYFINKLTFKKYSILRIIQILNLLKLNLRGNILDVGAKGVPIISQMYLKIILDI